MKAIILAAGRGSRMKGLTDDKPKCLNEIAKKTFFDWQLSALRESGIKDIVVARGYKKESLQGDFKTVDNERWDQTNMVSSLIYADQYLQGDDCIVSYADIVYHPDIINTLKNTDGDIVISYDQLWQPLWQERFEDPLSDAETFKVDQDGFVLEIGKKAQTLQEIEGQYMGLLKFTPVGWQATKSVIGKLTDQEIDKLDMTSLLQLIIQEGHSIKAVSIKGQWCEIDSGEDLKRYELILNKNETEGSHWTHDWRWDSLVKQ